MKLAHGLLLLLASIVCAGQANAHGRMIEPRSRNARNYIEGRDYNSNSVNENEQPYGTGNVVSACGITQFPGVVGAGAKMFDYDHPPFNWNTEASYTGPGQQIDVEVLLSTNHEGYFEFFLCDDINSPTKACFDQHPLKFVSDLFYPTTTDSISYPTRAYVPPESYTGYKFVEGEKAYKYRMELPRNAPTGNVLLQWRYTTGNTCQLWSGYTSDYNARINGTNTQSGYSSLALCFQPLPDARTEVNFVPERFWNCAEVAIGNSPTPPSPLTPQPPSAPSSTFASCSGTRCGSDYNNAYNHCGISCTAPGWDACPYGEACYTSLRTDLTCCSSTLMAPPQTPPPPPLPSPSSGTGTSPSPPTTPSSSSGFHIVDPTFIWLLFNFFAFLAYV